MDMLLEHGEMVLIGGLLVMNLLIYVIVNDLIARVKKLEKGSSPPDDR